MDLTEAEVAQALDNLRSKSLVIEAAEDGWHVMATILNGLWPYLANPLRFWRY